MQIALDTNILAYAEGMGDAPRCHAATRLIARLPQNQSLLPAQTLGELFRVLTTKGGRGAESARAAILSWSDAFAVADSTWTAFQAAFDLAADHQMSIWDALIFSVAAENRCRILLSEDFQDGFTARGLTIVNPFAKPHSELLAGLLLAAG